MKFFFGTWNFFFGICPKVFWKMFEKFHWMTSNPLLDIFMASLWFIIFFLVFYSWHQKSRKIGISKIFACVKFFDVWVFFSWGSDEALLGLFWGSVEALLRLLRLCWGPAEALLRLRRDPVKDMLRLSWGPLSTDAIIPCPKSDCAYDLAEDSSCTCLKCEFA